MLTENLNVPLILVVEDDELHVSAIQRSFEHTENEYRLSFAKTLSDAKAVMARQIPDLIIADYKLPEGDGTELLLETNGLCPVILMTSHGNEQVAVDAMKAGVQDYIVKSASAFETMPLTVKHALTTWLHIAERKRELEEKGKLQEQLQQAHKMESVGRLAGGVAHDFNNLLTVILGCVHLAIEESDPDKPVYEYLLSIKKAGEKSAELTRQLLAFARKQPIQPKVLDLNETVAGMLNMLQRLIGEDINLNWQPKANLWPVKMDPSQVDQILANLCVNARDAISDTGNITIETGNITLDEQYCAHNAGSVPGEYVRISVSDSGSGIDKETLAHIFEPFFTTKRPGKGTGLGLATVFGAVKQNNGFIAVNSESGSGTTFTIYMPRHLDNENKTPREEEDQSPPRGDETILLVEDEKAILDITRIILGKLGYTVLATSSATEAVRLVKENTGEIQLLITDVIMPEENGMDLAKKLMSLTPKLKCLFTSGYTADVISKHGVLNEGIHFIKKPYTLPDLATKVRDVLDKEMDGDRLRLMEI